MADRPRVQLSDDDGLAALQILAHLAYPHRPDFALNVLMQWARHRAKIPPLEKWSRVQPKLSRLDDMVKRRLKGSYILRWRMNKAGGVPLHSKGLREAAQLFGGQSGNKEENVIRDLWTPRVAHMGLATGDALLLANSPQERLNRQWDLVRVAFRPDWVRLALPAAEENAATADRLGVTPITSALFFTRDIL